MGKPPLYSTRRLGMTTQGTVSVRSQSEKVVTAPGDSTTRALGERLVKLGRIKAGLAPVLSAARASVATMEELYRDQGIKDPIYHDMKAIVGPMERLNQRVDDEIEKLLKRLDQEQIPDQVHNEVDLRASLKRNLHKVG